MTDIEERLSSFLTSAGEAVEVHPDLPRVLDATAVVAVDSPRPAHRQRRVLLPLGVAASVVVLIASIVVSGAEDSGVRTASSGTGEAAPVENAPPLLLAATGWRLESATDLAEDEGGMTFTDGADHWLELHWYPASQYAAFVANRRQGSKESRPAVIAGRGAVVFQFPGRLDFSAVWLDGDRFFDLRTSTIDDLDDFLAAATTLEEVDLDTWLAALSAAALALEEAAATIETVLDDLPLPPRPDIQPLPPTWTIPEGVDLDHDAVKALVCAWIEQLIDTVEAGDAAAAQAAADALESRQWPELLANDPEFAAFIRQVVDAIRAGTSIPPVGDYLRILGCAEG